MCYQSAHKYMLEEIFNSKITPENTIVILDEIHDSLSLVYHKFNVKNLVGTDIPRMGLSATIDKKTEYDTEEGIVKKIEMLNSFCPIIYRHTMEDGWEDGTSRELVFYVIKHKLDMNTKNILAGTKDKPFNTTEFSMYQYLDKQFKRSLFLPKSNTSREFLIRGAASKRARLLYNLPSKIEACKKLLSNIFERSIVFGNDIDVIEQITPYCISSNNSKEKNKEYLEKFQNKEINVIGSFKMLQQGSNLNDLDVVVLHSYYGKTKQFIQSVGRLRLNGKLGHVFVFVTEGTQEQVWFNNMTDDINLEIINCKSVEDAINKYRSKRSSG